MLKQAINIFKGRINRKQYLIGCFLFLPILFICAMILFGLAILPVFSILNITNDNVDTYIQTFLSIVLVIYMAIINIKRLHDLNHSGTGYIIFVFILSLINALIGRNPLNLIGLFITIYLLSAPGTTEDNEFGSNTKNKSAYQAIFNTIKNEEKIKFLPKIKNFLIKFIVAYLITLIIIALTHFTVIPYLQKLEIEEYKKTYIEECKTQKKSEKFCSCEFDYTENKLGFEKLKKIYKTINLITLLYKEESKQIEEFGKLISTDKDFLDWSIALNEASKQCKN